SMRVLGATTVTLLNTVVPVATASLPSSTRRRPLGQVVLHRMTYHCRWAPLVWPDRDFPRWRFRTKRRPHSQKRGLTVSTLQFKRSPRLSAPRPPGGEVHLEPPPEVPRVIPGSIVMKMMPVVMIVAMLGMVVMMFTLGGPAGRS